MFVSSQGERTEVKAKAYYGLIVSLSRFHCPGHVPNLQSRMKRDREDTKDLRMDSRSRRTQKEVRGLSGRSQQVLTGVECWGCCAEWQLARGMSRNARSQMVNERGAQRAVLQVM